MRVQSCMHLTASGLEKPVFTLVLQGVPSD